MWSSMALLVTISATVSAADLAPDMQARVQAKLKEVAQWAAEPRVVAAVRAHNAAPPAGVKEMTQDKWKELSLLDPSVRAFSKNDAAEALKTHKSDAVTEMFLSGADGRKVAFLAKPTNFSHAGKEKHAVPMTGKPWVGPVELDQSTGQKQVQVAAPVVDGGRAIGSLVVGLSLTKLQ